MRLCAVAICLAAWPARADVHGEARPELRLGAGYDDNLFLDARPSGPLPTQVRSDAIFDVEPRVEARLTAARHTLALSADFLERLTPSNGDLRDLAARFDYLSPRLGPLTLGAAALYEYYGTSQFPEDTFHLAGGEAGIRWAIADRLRLSARYRAAARAYPDPARAGQLDVEQRVFAALEVRAHRAVALEVGYHFLHLASNDPQAELDRHGATLTVTVRPLGWLLGAASYGVSAAHLPSGMLDAVNVGPRDDLAHSVDVALVARPLRWLELFARYSLLYSSSSSPAGGYQRDQVIAGASLLVEAAHTWTRPRPAAPELAGARVTFRYAGVARAVSVVGDWNRWDPAASPLAPSRGGFEGRITLPPGRHEYAFSVDGVVTRPPDAPGYRPDGFGGENGVVTVP